MHDNHDLLTVECVLASIACSRMKLISRIALRNRCGLIFSAGDLH